MSNDLVTQFFQTEASFRDQVLSGMERLLTVDPEEAIVCAYHSIHHFLLFAQICAAYGQREQALRYLKWGRPHVWPSASGYLQEVEALKQHLEDLDQA